MILSLFWVQGTLNRSIWDGGLSSREPVNGRRNSRSSPTESSLEGTTGKFINDLALWGEYLMPLEWITIISRSKAAHHPGPRGSLVMIEGGGRRALIALPSSPLQPWSAAAARRRPRQVASAAASAAASGREGAQAAASAGPAAAAAAASAAVAAAAVSAAAAASAAAAVSAAAAASAPGPAAGSAAEASARAAAGVAASSSPSPRSAAPDKRGARASQPPRRLAPPAAPPLRPQRHPPPPRPPQHRPLPGRSLGLQDPSLGLLHQEPRPSAASRISGSRGCLIVQRWFQPPPCPALGVPSLGGMDTSSDV